MRLVDTVHQQRVVGPMPPPGETAEQRSHIVGDFIHLGRRATPTFDDAGSFARCTDLQRHDSGEVDVSGQNEPDVLLI